jgi:hypothetical protein
MMKKFALMWLDDFTMILIKSYGLYRHVILENPSSVLAEPTDFTIVPNESKCLEYLEATSSFRRMCLEAR